jgi:hypothetical protein
MAKSKKNISQMARDKGLNPKIVHSRIHAGWTLDRALNTPVRKHVSPLVTAVDAGDAPESMTVEPECKTDYPMILAGALVGFLFGMAIGCL